MTARGRVARGHGCVPGVALRGEGGEGSLPTWRRGSKGPLLRGSPRRVAASRRSVAGQGGGVGRARVVRSPRLLPAPRCGFRLCRSSGGGRCWGVAFGVLCLRVGARGTWKVSVSRVRRGPHPGSTSCVPGGVSRRAPPSPRLYGTGAPAWARGHSSGVCSPPRPLCAPGASGRWGGVPGPGGSWLASGGGAPAAPVAGFAEGGARQGGLACPASRLARLPVARGPRRLFGPGRPGDRGRWVRFTVLVVSGSVSVAVCARVPRAAGAHHIWRYPPLRARRRRSPPRPGWGASPLLARACRQPGGLGGLRPGGSLLAGGGNLLATVV